MVRDELVLIQEIQSPDWWQDVTVAMLEHVRKKLRSLVHLIEKRRRKILYTDFQDGMGEATQIDLLGVAPQESMQRFRDKLRAYLTRHED
jgi:type I restriction enzyme R subunit